MRTNKKTQILQAIEEIVEKSGLSAVTYESVSQASGLSKSGLIYHFPSREDMITELHRYMAEDWNARLEHIVGCPAEEATPAQRLRGNLAMAAHRATRSDLLVSLDALDHPVHAQIWREVLDKWNPPLDDVGEDDDATARYLVQLIADGLWAGDQLNLVTMSGPQKQALLAAAERLIPDDA